MLALAVEVPGEKVVATISNMHERPTFSRELIQSETIWVRGEQRTICSSIVRR